MKYTRYATYRDERGMRDSDVSKATGIARSTFLHWKQSQYTPKLDKLMKIAKLFSVSLDELIGDELERN